MGCTSNTPLYNVPVLLVLSKYEKINNELIIAPL